MTIQMMIEADTHEEFVSKLKGIAAALGSTERVETKAADEPLPTLDTSEPEQPEPQPQQEEASTGGIPNPTKATVALAEEKGVDLAAVTGTGKHGRVTQADVKKYAAERDEYNREYEADVNRQMDEEQAEEPADTPAADPFAEDEQEKEPAPASIEPTAENTTAALKAVNAEKGMDVCVEILGEYGCRRVSEVPAESRPAFIEFCANKLGVGTGELASRIAA